MHLTRDKCQGVASPASSPGAADTVDVVVVGAWGVVVDDMGDVSNVDTTGGNVGGDQNVDVVVPELFEGALPLALGFAAVDGVGFEAAGHQVFAEAFDAALGVIEDQ